MPSGLRPRICSNSPDLVRDALIDVRDAARILRRNAGFTSVAVMALALGIAANTAIFSVVDRVLLEPLPYSDPDRLVQLMTTSPLGGQTLVSVPKYALWRERTKSFQYMAAYDTTGPSVNLAISETQKALETARVSADYFRLFGAAAVLGRTFSDADDQPDAPRVALISHDLWRRRFAANPLLVGDTLSLEKEPYKVIGVIAPGFTADRPVDLWLPLRASVSLLDHMNRVRVAARLLPGVSAKEAAADVAGTKTLFLRRYRSAPLLFREEFTAIPLRDALVGDVRPALLLLAAAVACVLLIACANAASLVLARSSRRAAEIAVRSALGAGRPRLIRQLLTENMLIALAAGPVGLALGFCGIRGLLAVSPAELPRVGANGSAIALDWRVFLFTLTVSLVSGVLFGLMPALSASRVGLMSLINDAPIQSGMGFRRSGRRAVLVIAQIALALVLLEGAGLLVRTFVADRTTNPGFDERQVLTAEMSLNNAQFGRTDEVSELVRRMKGHLEQIPGVSCVATTSSLPLEPSLQIPFTITKHDQTMVGRYHGVAAWRSVSPGFFDTLRIRLLQGRFFSKDDNRHSAGVMLISRAMMRKFWPEVDADPVGEFLIIGHGVSAALEDRPRQIVGIVDDVREAGLNREPMMYVPLAQLSDAMMAWQNRVLPITWVIRTSDERASRAIVEHNLSEASGLPLGRVRAMREVLAAALARPRFYVLLLSVFSAIALVLASVGLYSVMAYSVQQRRREIGLRMALGAGPQHIRGMVVWQGMRLAILGIIAGVPAALALNRVMVSLIFGARPVDAAVIAAVSALLAAVALAAAYLPSARAIEVDPCESLGR